MRTNRHRTVSPYLRLLLTGCLALAVLAGCGGSEEAYDCSAIDETELSAAVSFQTIDGSQGRGNEGDNRWIYCDWETPDTKDADGETLIRFVNVTVGDADLYTLWADLAQQGDTGFTELSGFGQQAMYATEPDGNLLTLRVRTEKHSISVGIHNRSFSDDQLLDQAKQVAALVDQA